MYLHSFAGNILAERTDKKKGVKKTGSLSRKLSAAMGVSMWHVICAKKIVFFIERIVLKWLAQALGDFSYLSDWIKEQVESDIEDQTERPQELKRCVVVVEFAKCISRLFLLIFFIVSVFSSFLLQTSSVVHH